MTDIELQAQPEELDIYGIPLPLTAKQRGEQLVRVADLAIPYDYETSRVEGSADAETMKASLDLIGQICPIVITDGLEVLDGIARLRAARELGLETLRATYVGSLSEAECTELRIHSNLVRRVFSPLEAFYLFEKKKALLAKEGRNKQVAAGQVRAADRYGNESVALTNFVKATDEADSPVDAKIQAAEGLGVSSETLRKIGKIKQGLEDPDAPSVVRVAAEHAIELLKANKPVDAAYKVFRNAQASTPEGVKFIIDRTSDPALFQRLMGAVSDFISKTQDLPTDRLAAYISRDNKAWPGAFEQQVKAIHSWTGDLIIDLDERTA